MSYEFKRSLGPLVLIISILCGCNTVPPSPSAPLVSPPAKPAALKVAGFTDVTGSATRTRTAQLTAYDFKPIIDRLKLSGGELGVGLISDRSNKPLLRLRIDAPPAAPIEPQTAAVDIDTIAELMDKYVADKQTYDTKLTQWQATTEKSIKVFEKQLVDLLEQPPTAPRSAVFQAIDRGDLFLNENDPDFPREITPRIILLNSDCEDNVGKAPIVLRSHARIIVVNGVGSLGSLATLDPKPDFYESIGAAIREITKGGK